jgi:hypothetical protein
MVNLGGRPAHFETPEEMAKAIQAVFDNPDFDFTITGLAFDLGFADRQSLYDYEKRDGFSCIVKKARLAVERAYEAKLSGNTVTGAIFALKNMGWKDKQEIEQSGGLTINWHEQLYSE